MSQVNLKILIKIEGTRDSKVVDGQIFEVINTTEETHVVDTALIVIVETSTSVPNIRIHKTGISIKMPLGRSTKMPLGRSTKMTKVFQTKLVTKIITKIKDLINKQ